MIHRIWVDQATLYDPIFLQSLQDSGGKHVLHGRPLKARVCIGPDLLASLASEGNPCNSVC